MALEHKELISIILYKVANYKISDSIISVTAPLESRIQIIERDKTTRDQVLGRINSQWTDEQRVSKTIMLLKTLIVKCKNKEEILKILRIKQRILKC
jgi:dephospho-CoA kinase